MRVAWAKIVKKPPSSSQSRKRRAQIGLRRHQQQCALPLECPQIVEAIKRFSFVIVRSGRVIKNAARLHIFECMLSKQFDILSADRT